MTESSLYLEIEIPAFNKYKGLAFFAKDVENCQTIKENLIKGNTDYDYAFINAKNIVSLEQIYSSFYRAMVDDNHGIMKSRTLHTEVIYALSPFKNIMDCLNKFGVSKDSNSLLIIKISPAAEFDNNFITRHLENVSAIVKGNLVPLAEETFHECADVKAIEKNFKIKIRNTTLEGNWEEITRTLVAVTQLKGL